MFEQSKIIIDKFVMANNYRGHVRH